MIKPNLFIVGEPKSGTTTLYQLLRQHPDVFLSEDKEPSFFCKDFIEESINFYGSNLFFHYQDLDSYLKLFKKARNEKIVGEATTRYLYSKTAAKEISNFNPDAKIVMMLREPVEFLHSLHSQYLSNPFEDERDFAKALALEKSRKKGKNIPKVAKFPSQLYYRERAKYAEHIQRFLNHFTTKQIFVIILENFRDDMEETYERLLNFLELPEFKPNFKIVNTNTEPHSQTLFNTMHSPRLKMFLWRVFPKSFFIKLRNLSTKLLLKKTKRTPLDSEVRKQLMRDCNPEVENINKLLNEKGLIHQDLKALWGYHAL